MVKYKLRNKRIEQKNRKLKLYGFLKKCSNSSATYTRSYLLHAKTSH